jgi:hypothetical protein
LCARTCWSAGLWQRQRRHEDQRQNARKRAHAEEQPSLSHSARAFRIVRAPAHDTRRSLGAEAEQAECWRRQIDAALQQRKETKHKRRCTPQPSVTMSAGSISCANSTKSP